MHPNTRLFCLASSRCRWSVPRAGASVVASGVLGLAGLMGLLGCQDLTGSQALPAGVNAPSYYYTPSGARGMYTAALYQVEQALPSYMADAGALTDELESASDQASPGVQSAGSGYGPLDSRNLPTVPPYGSNSVHNLDNDYSSLQGARGAIAQALGALAAYDTLKADTATVKVRRGELYALYGYVELLLADLYCSGVPLSTFDFQGTFTYQAGSTTLQVYADAVVKEDSALVLADTSTQVLNLARVLKGRALLAQGQYAQAAQAVAAVPGGFQYQLAAQWGTFGSGAGQSSNLFLDDGLILSDREGINGLPYLSSHDPRIADTVTTTTVTGINFTFPAKYESGVAFGSFAPFTVADWIEARLIQAEGALHPGGAGGAAMVGLLNHLRDSARVFGQTTALADTTDPGTDTAEVSLLFRERAFWLYMTGHRQGDLRRLIRQYGRPQEQVYPTGQYPGGGVLNFGSSVNVSIPGSEYINPKFTGCINRGA
jgi:hypothetical protein